MSTRPFGRAEEGSGSVAGGTPAAFVPVSSAFAALRARDSGRVSAKIAPLALIAGALTGLLAVLTLTSAPALAGRAGPLMEWTQRHREDVRLTAFAIAAAIVVGVLVARLGGGSG
jgi:hypothetical protein